MSKLSKNLTKERIKARARVTKDKTKATLRRGKQSIFSRIAKIIFHRMFFVSLGILLQLLIMAAPIIWFARYVALFYFVYIIIATIAVLKIISSRYQSAYKISWVVLVLAVPVFGGCLLYTSHRSVALACKLADWVREQGYTVSEYHRDVTRV